MTTQNHYQQASAAPGPGSGSAMPHPPPPGSPTLTNPDMILPEDERPTSPDRSPSPLRMWKGPVTINDMQYHMPLQNAYNAGPNTPTTPIIYGNGTMLSDIGEVTEVESNVGGPSYRASPAPLYNGTSDAALGSSPTMGAHGGGSAATVRKTIIKKRSKTAARERSDSIDSTSTITSGGRPAPFADFDDTVSVDDSVFQGDDEESVAESFADDVSVHSTRSHNRGNGGGLNEENRFSTSSIGRRAELILANAKKRLTTMEGNLSRARSTLYINSSLSSDGSTSAPSPPIHTADGASSDPNTTAFKFGHSRMRSDNLIRPDVNPGSPPGTSPQRSASALGAAGGYRQPLSASKSVDGLKLNLAKPPYRTSLPGPETSLEPLSEDEMSHEPRARGSAELDNFLSPTFGPAPERPASRPGSVTQMRELKEQVHGLKGRISSLREQAKADSLKRRSLQSLRIPSPFTNAEVDQWLPGPPPPQPQPVHEDAGPSEADVEHATKDASHPGPVFEEDESGYSEYEMASEGLRSHRSSAFVNGTGQNEDHVPGGVEQEHHVPIENDVESLDEFHDGRDDFDYASESGDSLYHDAPQTALSHEDREDAFDYEHFFLHSAMGTLSQEHLGRRGSFSSEDSVETTKGPIATPERNETTRRHSRRGSGDTTSTSDTFATADEEGEERQSTRASYYDASSGATDEPRPDSEPETKAPGSFPSPSSDEDVNGIGSRRRHNSVIYRPTSKRASVLHRPSVSSFESMGTTRSFPLMNGKVKMNGGVLTPRGSPDEELKSVSEALMSETTSICEKEAPQGRSMPVIQALNKEDQILVQRLIASLGRCVLGLSDAGQASPEGRVYRRRLYEAKRLLEGLESTAE